MAKRLNYTIGVDADTSKFEASLQKAIADLNKLNSINLSAGLTEANKVAVSLAGNLRQAINPETGKLDLTNFNNNLKQSGETLNSYYQKLAQLGPAGERAFLSVARSITEAELPLKRSNKLLNELWITMKNTMRWQLTSSALHSFVGSLEQAYGYSKNLDRSLNEIRIVSEKSAEDMARFAEQANKAAKALSTTTTSYTDASLIYYQQGLTDQEVLDRTETTIKMANVAGTTAEQASQQLTAIWNNFYKEGSQSLEHYADVMVKLGAATASSSDEISEGIEKFAAVANTVGLSYEYAASALATVTAQTRESASVVGTAFRTLFSRIQGLQQGETLDDGTSLNKYSEALAKVGVQIKDTDGQLKDMDQILDDLGGRWNSLAKDQKIALAETVAGVRQWTQLIALMDNWDFFKQNLSLAKNADGALEQQAEIYAESWEAARDRVTASAEDVYDSLVNKDFFISFDNSLSKVLDRTADFIDGMGGLAGVLATLSKLTLTVFGDKIEANIRSMVQNIGLMTGYEQTRSRELQAQAAILIKNTASDNNDLLEMQRTEVTQAEVDYQIKLNAELDKMTDSEKRVVQGIQEAIKLRKEEYEVALNTAKATKAQIEEKSANLSVSGRLKTDFKSSEEKSAAMSQLESLSGVQKFIRKDNGKMGGRKSDTEIGYEALDKLIAKYKEAASAQANFSLVRTRNNSTFKNDTKQIEEYARSLGMTEEQIQKIVNAPRIEKVLSEGTDEATRKLEELRKVLVEMFHLDPSAVDNLAKEIQKLALQTSVANIKAGEYESTLTGGLAVIKQVSIQIKDLASGLVTFASMASSVAMITTSFKSLVDVFSDDSLSDVERFTTLLGSLSLIIPNLIDLMSKFGKIKLFDKWANQLSMNIELLGFWKRATLGQAAAEGVLNTAETTQITLLLAKAAIIAAVIAAIALLAAGIYLLVKAYNADADAAKEAAAGVEILSKAYDDAKNAATELKDTINDWNSAIQSIDDLTENTKEYADAIKTANDKAKELIESQGLFDRSKWYYDDKGIIQFADGVLEDLQSQADARERQARSSLYAGQIYSNNASIKSETTNLRRSFDSNDIDVLYEINGRPHDRSLTNSEIQNAAELLKETQDAEPISDTELVGKFKELIPGLNLSIDSLDDFRAGLETLSKSMDKVSEANDYYSKEILKSDLESNREKQLKDIAGDNENLYNGLLDAYAAREAQALEERDQVLSNVTVAKNKYSSNSALANYIGQSINGDEELARVYASMVLGRTDVDQLNYKGGWNKGQLQTSNGENLFDEALSDDYMRKMIAQTYAQQQLINSLGEGLDNFNQEAYEASLKKLIDGANSLGNAFSEADFATTILNQLAQGTESIDLSSLFAQLSPDDIAQLTGMSQEELYTALGLNEKDLTTLGITDAKAWYNSFIASLKSYDPSSFYEHLNQAAISGEKSARSLIDSIQSGDTTYENIGENEEYQNLIDQLNILKSQYPELQADAIELSKTWEVGTQKFAEALEDVQDRLAQIKLDNLTNDAKKASDKLKDFLGEQESDWTVKIEANPEEFTSTMDELLDANYAVDIEIHTQAEQEFDSIKNAMQDIEDQASKIGENFVVSANDIRELNNTFPGIIQGMEEVGDGSVRLNHTVAKNAIDAARTEVAADAKATVDRLKSQASLLRAKQQVYEQMATAASVLAGAETDSAMTSSEAQATLSGGLSDLEQLNSKASTTVKLDNQEKTADSAFDNGLITAKNWDSAFDSAAQSSAKFANAAIANMQAVANNDAGAVTNGSNFGVKYTGSTGKSQEAAVLEETQKMLDEADTVSEQAWADLAAKYQNVADSAGASANDIEGMMAEIGSSTADLNKLFNNVSSGKGPKGGSGSKGKTYDTEDRKDPKEVEDRYHNINRALERQEDLLEDLDNAADRAWGTEALDSYGKKLKALKDQQQLYNTKLKDAEDYLHGIKGKREGDLEVVQKYFKEAQIGANGEITNYEELLQKNLKLYNAAVDRYNLAVKGKTLTEEQHTALKNQLDTEKKLFDKRQDALKQYESTIDTIRELNDNLEENARAQADLKLTEIKTKMEIVLDIKSMKDTVRDLSKEISEMFGDALTHGIESAELSMKSAQAEAALLPSYQEEWDSLKELYNSTTDEADRKSIMDEIKSLQSNIANSAKAIADWVNSIEDIIPDAVSAASERFSAFTDQLEHNTSVLDTIKELYTLQGVTYKTAAGFNRLQRNSQEKLNAQVASAELQKGWYDEAAKRLEEAQEKLDSLGGNETDLRYDTYKKARDAYLEEFNQAQEAYLSSAKEAMETAQDMYVQQIERATYLFGQAVSNNVGLDLLQDKYDHYIESEERYFDKVNEAYQVASWYNKLQQDIDDTTNVAYKNRLKALQEEIDKRKEGNKLSQYDLDILNAKYQLLQAQQALEDAQNAKNKIQLVRDSQGNWNYQYTANQDDIAKAEQDVLDAQNNWYNIAKDQTKQVAGEIVSMWQECTDAVEQLYKDLANGDISEEEYLKKKEEIEQYYTEKAKYLEEEKTQAIKDMNEAGYEELKNIAEKNGETVKEFENVYAKELESMTDSNKNFADMLDKYLQQCDDKFNNYKDTVKQVASDTGTTLGNLAEETDKVSEATDQVKQRGDEAKYTLWEMADAASGAAEKYLDLANSMWQAVRAMQTLTGAQANFATSKGTKAYDENTDYTSMIIQGLANGYINYGDNTYNSLIKQLQDKAGEGANLDLDQFKSYKKGDTPAGWAAGRYNTEEEWRKNLENLKKNYGLDTGGYTGLFDDAKLAFLHQKELVLNQSDTENILAAVQAVRTIGTDLFKSIEKSLDGNAIAAMALMGQKLNPIATTPVQDSIEQTVHIDKVEFPNVTSRTEIEEAFISLTNDAAQWARRKT